MFSTMIFPSNCYNYNDEVYENDKNADDDYDADHDDGEDGEDAVDKDNNYKRLLYKDTDFSKCIIN